MHFKTVMFAGLTSLAAVAALPSGQSGHGAHVAARHHRFIRPRKADPEPASSKKRCAVPTTSSSSEEPEATEYKGGNLAKATPTYSTKSAKFTPTGSDKPAPTKSGKPHATDSEAPSSTTSADNGEPTPNTGTGGIVIGDKMLAIFPAGVKAGMSRWSTDPAVKGALALSDANLGATSVIGRLAHPVVDFDGKKAMKISYARGSYAYRSKALGGVSMYALGPSSQRIDNAKKLTLSYSVQFSKGFQFNKGGKLPGLYGGTSEKEAAGCSGGRGRPTCWSSRFMWREGGAGELYSYLPTDAKATNKAAVCDPKNTSCDLGYGWSLGRGKWTWQPGTWQKIAQLVTLNDIGKPNGSIVTYLDGKEVYRADNIMLRTQKAAMPRGVMIQSFFGGHDASWASPQDQQMYLSDFSLAVLETE